VSIVKNLLNKLLLVRVLTATLWKPVNEAMSTILRFVTAWHAPATRFTEKHGHNTRFTRVELANYADDRDFRDLQTCLGNCYRFVHLDEQLFATRPLQSLRPTQRFTRRLEDGLNTKMLIATD